MKFDVDTLPDDSTVLKEMLVESQARFDRETSILLEQIRHLRAQLFGRKSEKLPRESNVELLPLFDMPEDAAPEDVEAVEVPAHTRKKTGRKPLPEELPRVEVEHDIDEADKVCGCGEALTRIGEEVSEQLDIIPAKVQVIRNIRPKYACRSCEGVNDEGPTVRIAPPPPQIIPKSLASAGLLAFILTGKFTDHIPFYRQEKQFSRLGVELSRTLMCRWAMQVASACQPLLNLLQDELLAGKYIQIDETTVQVLKEQGRDPTTNSYMWVYRRGDPNKQVLLFAYHPTRCGDVVQEFLHDYQGCVQTDGYKGYDFLDKQEGVRHIGCLAHARRKFADIVKAQGKKAKPGSAHKAVSFFKRLYKVEKEWRVAGLSAQEVYQRRQEQSKPILDDFKEWLIEKKLRVPPKSAMGKAVAYSLNQWHRLVGYLEDGCYSPDNNAAENSIRPFVVGRKNWMFSGTPEGAQASALLFSLIETAKANKVEPYSYLRHIFNELPKAKTLEDYEALLPWNVDLGIIAR